MYKFGDYPKIEKRIIKKYIDDLRDNAIRLYLCDTKAGTRHYRDTVAAYRKVAKELTKILKH